MSERERGRTALARIDQIAESNLLSVSGGKIQRAILIADAMQELRQLITADVLKSVQTLQGTDLGFRTDKDDKGGYAADTVRDVLIEAAIRGYSPTGNEFNIIAGRFYPTKNGLERKVREFPGLSDLKMVEGVPQRMTEGALVEYHAQWRLNGKPDRIDCINEGASDTRIAVRVNQGMGVDAILGKARRKMLARIYARLTGSTQLMDEVDDMDETDRIDTMDSSGMNRTDDLGTERGADQSTGGKKVDVQTTLA